MTVTQGDDQSSVYGSVSPQELEEIRTELREEVSLWKVFFFTVVLLRFAAEHTWQFVSDQQ